jgi:hypothetical protein
VKLSLQPGWILKGHALKKKKSIRGWGVFYSSLVPNFPSHFNIPQSPYLNFYCFLFFLIFFKARSWVYIFSENKSCWLSFDCWINYVYFFSCLLIYYLSNFFSYSCWDINWDKTIASAECFSNWIRFYFSYFCFLIEREREQKKNKNIRMINMNMQKHIKADVVLRNPHPYRHSIFLVPLLAKLHIQVISPS